MASVLDSMHVEAEEDRTVVKVCGNYRTWRVKAEGEGLNETFYITANPPLDREDAEDKYRSLYDAVGALKIAEDNDGETDA